MSLKFLTFLNLNDSFTQKDLDVSYDKKINEINSMNISSIDKDYFKDSVNRAYYKASKYLQGRNMLQINNSFFNNLLSLKNHYNNNLETSNSYSESIQKSSSQILNPDKSITITEKTIKNKNGQIEEKNISYKKYPDGTIKYLTN